MFEVAKGKAKGGGKERKRKGKRKRKRNGEGDEGRGVDDLNTLRRFCRVFDSASALSQAGGPRALDGKPYCVTVHHVSGDSLPKQLAGSVRAIEENGLGFFLVPSSSSLAKAGVLHIVAGFRDIAAAKLAAGSCMRYAASEKRSGRAFPKVANDLKRATDLRNPLAARAKWLFANQSEETLAKLKLDKTGAFSATDETTAADTAKLALSLPGVTRRTTVVDLTGGIGGNTLGFAAAGFKRVVAYEIDSERCQMLEHNARVLGHANAVEAKAGDALQGIAEMPKNDLVNALAMVDPPWGGLNYKVSRKVTCKLGSKDMPAVLRVLRAAGFAWAILKLPFNATGVEGSEFSSCRPTILSRKVKLFVVDLQSCGTGARSAAAAAGVGGAQRRAGEKEKKRSRRAKGGQKRSGRTFDEVEGEGMRERGGGLLGGAREREKEKEQKKEQNKKNKKSKKNKEEVKAKAKAKTKKRQGPSASNVEHLLRDAGY